MLRELVREVRLGWPMQSQRRDSFLNDLLPIRHAQFPSLVRWRRRTPSSSSVVSGALCDPPESGCNNAVSADRLSRPKSRRSNRAPPAGKAADTARSRENAKPRRSGFESAWRCRTRDEAEPRAKIEREARHSPFSTPDRAIEAYLGVPYIELTNINDHGGPFVPS